MIAKNYSKIFLLKIVISIIAVALIFFWYTQYNTQNNQPTIVFIIDMQKSMGTKDIKDNGEQVHTRQQTAMTYVDYIVQHLKTATKVGVIRL